MNLAWQIAETLIRETFGDCDSEFMFSEADIKKARPFDEDKDRLLLVDLEKEYPATCALWIVQKYIQAFVRKNKDELPARQEHNLKKFYEALTQAFWRPFREKYYKESTIGIRTRDDKLVLVEDARERKEEEIRQFIQDSVMEKFGVRLEMIAININPQETTFL